MKLALILLFAWTGLAFAGDIIINDKLEISLNTDNDGAFEAVMANYPKRAKEVAAIVKAKVEELAESKHPEEHKSILDRCIKAGIEIDEAKAKKISDAYADKKWQAAVNSDE